MKRFRFGIAALVAGGCLAGAGAATAVQIVGAASVPRATLAPYHFTSPDMKIFSKDTKDVVITEFRIAAGGSTGWHVHPGPTFIIVTAGTLTRYEGSDPSCTGTTFGPNKGWVEAPGDVHLARNEGTETVVGMVAYLDVPVGGAVKTVVARPGNCPF